MQLVVLHKAARAQDVACTLSKLAPTQLAHVWPLRDPYLTQNVWSTFCERYYIVFVNTDYLATMQSSILSLTILSNCHSECLVLSQWAGERASRADPEQPDPSPYRQPQ